MQTTMTPAALLALVCGITVGACSAEGEETHGTNAEESADVPSASERETEAAEGPASEPQTHCEACMESECEAQLSSCDEDIFNPCNVLVSCVSDCNEGSPSLSDLDWCNRGCETFAISLEEQSFLICSKANCAECFGGSGTGRGGGGDPDACSTCVDACRGIPGCSCCSECGTGCFN
jgi:hypothetical protein